MKRFDEIREDFEKALERLDEAVHEASTELEEDGVIQRFEFTFELFWKFLKSHLLSEGIDCVSPRGCLKEAFRMGLIDDEETVLRMLEDRNMTAYT